jgi:hypothetical protein
MKNSYWTIKEYKTVLIKNDPGSKQPGFFFFEIPSKDDIINTENTEISTK